MGYAFLALALFAGVTKGYCGKKTGGYVHGVGGSVMANIIRMALCAVIGLVIVLAGGGASGLLPSGTVMAIALFSGVSTAVFVVSWLISVERSAYMMLDVFLMLGVLVPILAESLLFGESVALTQWLGIGILLVAVVLMCSYNNSIKKKLTLSALALLTLCGLSSGLADLSQKLFVRYSGGTPASVFNLYTYVFAGLTLIIAYPFLKGKKDGGRIEWRRVAVYIAIMAACLFANSYFKTLAAAHLSAVLLYPLNQGAALILSSLMSATLFRERLTVKAIAGIVTAFIGLLIINLL